MDAAAALTSVAARLSAIDWARVEKTLIDAPCARLPGVLAPDECASLVALYPDDRLFRSRVDMARHRFGVGEYKYFAAPLPSLVAELRAQAYPPLAGIANAWMRMLRSPERFPETLAAFERRCAEAGQRQPTPLLLRYEDGGYNCLHRDVYGSVAFPLQMTAFLSRPNHDYTGGEFLLVEQRPRAQLVAEVLLPEQGDLVVFPNDVRPVSGTRGVFRARVRHGVSRVRSGRRFTLGVIFHDAA
jgi:hypothetical protein